MQNIKNGETEFTVTRDHIALLKNLNMRTETFILDSGGPDGWFVNQPCIDEKRPFGNSGNPAEEALRTAGITPVGSDGTYDGAQLSYGRYLILSLPVAYRAVMAHGAIEPCSVKINQSGAACFSFRNKRPLEYWREEIAAACATKEVPAEQLITIIMNPGPESGPIGALRPLINLEPYCDWVRVAVNILLAGAAKRYTTAHPETASMPEPEIIEKLRSGDWNLEWDW